MGCDVSEYRSNRPSRIVESGVGFSRKIAPNRLVKMSISKVIELLNGETIDVDSVVVGDKPVSGGWLLTMTRISTHCRFGSVEKLP